MHEALLILVWILIGYIFGVACEAGICHLDLTRSYEKGFTDGYSKAKEEEAQDD